MDWLKSRNGQSAVEVLLAVTLMAMMTLAAFVLFGTTVSEGQFANDQRVAEGLETQAVEAVRQMRDRDFSLLTAGTHGLALAGTDWTFSGAEDVTSSLYHRSVAVTQVDADTRNVTVTITWTPRTGRTVSIDTVTRFTNWRLPPPPVSSNCKNEALTGDWTHPVTLGSADIGAGNQGTDIAVKWPYIFESGSASSTGKPDLFVFDATNVASPSLIASLDVGVMGINAISLSGNYIYAVTGNDSKEFIVIDVTNPAAPVVKSSLNLSGTADGIGVMAKGTLVAVGRDLSSASEVVFYDASNPVSPSVLASFNSADKVNDFATDNSYFYAVSKAPDEDIQVYNVTNPLSITLTSTYDIGDGTEDLSIAYEPPGYLFIGNVSDQFIIVDARNVLNMSEVSTYATGGQVLDVSCLTGSLLFLGTDNSTKEFQIVNIANLGALTQYASMNFPNFASGVEFVNGKAFLSVRSNDALRIIGPGP